MLYVVLDTDVASRAIKGQLGDPLAARLTGMAWCVTFTIDAPHVEHASLAQAAEAAADEDEAGQRPVHRRLRCHSHPLRTAVEPATDAAAAAEQARPVHRPADDGLRPVPLAVQAGIVLLGVALALVALTR
jgi:CTP:molybdopterin cytidylyltransferase MocA